MGKLMDMIGRDRINELLLNKVKNKELSAKIEENKLKSMQSLSAAIAEYQQQDQMVKQGQDMAPQFPDTAMELPPADPKRVENSLFSSMAMTNPVAAGQFHENMNDPK